MEPAEFLGRDEFEGLSEDAASRYFERFIAARDECLSASNQHERKLAYIEHFLNLCEWVLPPEEYERRYRRRFWDGVWEHAEAFASSLERMIASPEVSASEKANAQRNLDQVRAVVEHKKALAELEETSD